MPTVREARRLAVQALREAGIESAGLDARLLLEGALATRDLDPDRELDTEAVAAFGGFLSRRLAGAPVWRILGEREFWGLTFRLSPATLEPRPDSETIVEAALELAARNGLEGLTIGALAERMQMSKSGVFAHFGSREDLQIAVLKAYERRFVDEVLG